MRTDRYTEQLSGYLDGELSDLDRRRLEAHLQDCQACRTILADLRAIVAAAPHYQGKAPDADLWPGIAGRIGTVRFPGRRASSFPGGSLRPYLLLAASLLLVALGGGTVWLAMRPDNQQVAESSSRRAAEPPSAKTVAYAESQYQSAVADLERVLQEGRGRLDTATVRIVEENLRKIDGAIAEARAAIARDSTDPYLNRQLSANMRRKLSLLRSVADALART